MSHQSATVVEAAAIVANPNLIDSERVSRAGRAPDGEPNALTFQVEPRHAISTGCVPERVEREPSDRVTIFPRRGCLPLQAALHLVRADVRYANDHQTITRAVP